jgi:hypothetical protein
LQIKELKMEIEIKNIPKELGKIVESNVSIVDFYRMLANTIYGSINYSDAQAIAPIVFLPMIKNVGERFIILENGKMISEEPVLISLASKYGEPLVDRILRNGVACVLNNEIKRKFGAETIVEIEFINEGGIFIYIDGRAKN